MVNLSYLKLCITFSYNKTSTTCFGAQPRIFCRSLFKQLQILLVPCQCIFSLMIFIINNQEHFETNSSIHNINTRNKNHLHRSNANLSCFWESTFYAGIKIFNRAPPSLTVFKNDEAKFKSPLGKYLNTHFFCSVDEFCMCKDDL